MKVKVNKVIRQISLFVIAITLIIFGFNALFCQDSTNSKENDASGYYHLKRNLWSAGFFGGVSLNNHFVDFHALPTIPSCCPDYQTGFGAKFTFGGLFDYKFSEEYGLSMEFRASYANLGGIIKAEERELMYYDPTTSVEGLIEHTIETSIHTFLFDPILKYRIFENSSLHLGMSFGVIASTFFNQKEELLEPNDLTFENNQRVRMTYSGDIPNSTDFYTSITGGINYDFFLTKNKNWYISPELFLSYGLNNLIRNEKWNELSIRLALAVNYNGSTEFKKRYEQYWKIDTVKIEVPAIAENILVPGIPLVTYDTTEVEYILTVRENYYRVDTLLTKPEYLFTASLSTIALDSGSNEIKSPNLKVEEFYATRMEPLLNYVFFDSNSYKIPERYKLLGSDEIKDFKITKSFNHQELEFYYNILNIIGLKMMENPGANLTLTGCNTNLYSEKNNLTLSKNRAQSVKNYLCNVWKIEDSRIAVKARNLPEIPSNNKVSDGNQENRRVEINSDDIKIFSSVIAHDKLIELTFSDITDTSKKLYFGGYRFYTSVTPGIELKSWKLSVILETDTIKTFEGTGKLPSSHDWQFGQGKFAPKIFAKPLKFFLTATDINNRDAMALETPKIELITLDSKQIIKQKDLVMDTYSIMLFEYGSSKLSDPEFPKLVKSYLHKDAKVNIFGYSDRLGDDDFNLKLSIARSKTVADAIGHPNTIYKGFGESILLHNNDLPEGRFYSRNVDIVVQTPVHW